MINLIRTACLNAKGNQITARDVERAAAKEQNHFERFIPSDHYPVLVDIYRNKGIQLDPEAQAMMQSML
jgi:hypothetical protein